MRYILSINLLSWLLILGDTRIVKMHIFYESKLITIKTDVKLLNFHKINSNLQTQPTPYYLFRFKKSQKNQNIPKTDALLQLWYVCHWFPSDDAVEYA